MEFVYIYGLVDPRDKIIKYVGKSINPTKRLYWHIYHTLYAKKKRTKKENWINKLLINSLKPEIIILKECKKNDFELWEEFYIKKYNTVNYTNYDAKGIGKSSNPVDLGKLNKNERGVKILMYNLNGDLLCEYSSLRDAERLTGINHGNISKVCRKKYKHTKGFIFRYKSDTTPIKGIVNPNAQKKCVLMLDKNNKIIKKYESIAEAAKDNNIDASKISRICNKKIKNNKQFKFK